MRVPGRASGVLPAASRRQAGGPAGPGRPGRPRRGERGAAPVEFALVATLVAGLTVGAFMVMRSGLVGSVDTVTDVVQSLLGAAG